MMPYLLLKPSLNASHPFLAIHYNRPTSTRLFSTGHKTASPEPSGFRAISLSIRQKRICFSGQHPVEIDLQCWREAICTKKTWPPNPEPIFEVCKRLPLMVSTAETGPSWPKTLLNHAGGGDDGISGHRKMMRPSSSLLSSRQ